MRKRFVAKKRKKVRIHFKVRYLVYIALIYIGYQFLAGYLLKFQLTTNNEDFLLAMMHDSNHYVLYEKDSNSMLTKATKWLTGLDLKNPETILSTTFHYVDEKEKETGIIATTVNSPSSTSSSDNEQNESETNYVNDPKPANKETQNPRVYIYNTHQLEGYSMKNLEAYNITPNVMMASYLLREKLKEANIETLVEETDVNKYMTDNKWKVKDSYKVTANLIQNTLTKYPNMDLLIDIHRDAIPKSSSTVTIQNNSYAKILFVVGLEHDNYQTNLDLANKLNNLINQKYPGLSRGILKKQGSSVNGIYNQNINGKIVLIECGGYENTIDEVSNTVVALSEVIKEYLGG